MASFRTSLPLRLLRMNRYSLLLGIVVVILVGLLVTYVSPNSFARRWTIVPNSHVLYRKPTHLIDRQAILIPISINQLYDYRVVCAGRDATVSRTDLVNELSTRCHAKLNGTLKIDLHPPDDFQVRSSTTATYATRWSKTERCSIFDNETIAIIIPYRDRAKNLQLLLYNLIPLLHRQEIHNYKIFVIEQEAPGAFNKGRLYNRAFAHLMATYRPTCVIFHGKRQRCQHERCAIARFTSDVDLIAENDQNIYSCWTSSNHPIHMSAQVRFTIDGSYTPIYTFLVGGVLTIRPAAFQLLNGFSNRYFNWGGEDDDMGLRFLAKNMCVQRPIHGHYYAGSHSTQERNKNRFGLLFDAVLRQDTDGLSNIDRLASIAGTQHYPLVTWIRVTWVDGATDDDGPVLE